MLLAQAGRRRPAAVDCTQYIDSWNRQQNGNIIVSARYVQQTIHAYDETRTTRGE